MSEQGFSPWTPAIVTSDQATHEVEVPFAHLERVRALLHKHNVEHQIRNGEKPDYSVFEFASKHAATDLVKIFEKLDEA